MSLRRFAATTALALSAVLATGAPATASHIPSSFNCGTAGTFTSEGRVLPIGEQAPQGYVALLQGTASVLVALEVYANGQLVYTAPGIHANSTDEVTCTATINGVDFTIVGILT
jgi:hypothetical protein